MDSYRVFGLDYYRAFPVTLLQGKWLAQQNLTLDVDAAAKKLLAAEGYDPQFGARPLKRAVQEHILNPLSLRLLEGEFKPGDKIKVTTKDDELVFQKK